MTQFTHDTAPTKHIEAGDSDVAVYDGSLQEWTTNPELPLEGG
jgi:hypothetical protein